MLVSACANGWKSLSIFSADIPIPLSIISIFNTPCSFFFKLLTAA